MFKNGFFWVVALLITAGVGFIGWKATQPKTEEPLASVGEQVPDLGRTHVEDIYGVTYNSNPPTSGTHFPVWSKKGVYNKVISDGYLIHSLEHGYIVAYYNCDLPLADANLFNFQLVKSVSAHDGVDLEATDSGVPLYHMATPPNGGSTYTPETAPDAGVTLSEKFASDECKNLVSQISELGKSFDRYIVMPRPNMDTPIALTAWTRLLKMNSWDKAKAEEFASAYHNKGPERTME